MARQTDRVVGFLWFFLLALLVISASTYLLFTIFGIGATVNVTPIVMLLLLLGGTMLTFKLIRQKEPMNFFLIIVAVGGLVALFVYFPQLGGELFKGAITEMQAILGVG